MLINEMLIIENFYKTTLGKVFTLFWGMFIIITFVQIKERKGKKSKYTFWSEWPWDLKFIMKTYLLFVFHTQINFD